MKWFLLLVLAVLLTACSHAAPTQPPLQPPVPLPSRDPFARVYLRIDSVMPFDTSVSYLEVSTLLPPQGYGVTGNGRTDTLLTNQWFVFNGLADGAGRSLCTQIFAGAGFTGVQTLAFVVIPVRLTLHGVPTKWSGGGDNGWKPDTLIRYYGTSHGNVIDTVVYTPVVTGIQGGAFDPFALPLPAPWGRDINHLTTWNIHVTDTTRVLVPRADSIPDCSHL